MKKISSLIICFLFAAAVLGSQGCSLVTIKQLSRNNLNEETMAKVKPCVTTEEELVALFRKPTDDFMREQGEYDIYIYMGYAGNLKIEEQKFEVMLNENDVVVDTRLNYQGNEPMQDRCL